MTTAGRAQRFGDMTVATALTGKAKAVNLAAIATFVGQTATAVSAKLRGKQAYRVRDALQSWWPDSVDALRHLRVVDARSHNLLPDIADLTALGLVRVKKILEGAHGSMTVPNALADARARTVTKPLPPKERSRSTVTTRALPTRQPTTQALSTKQATTTPLQASASVTRKLTPAATARSRSTPSMSTSTAQASAAAKQARMTASGTQIGGYTLQQFIAKGGFAETWRAEHPQHRSAVVLKQLLAGGKRDDLERELAAIERLSHPNICKLLDVVYYSDGRIRALIYEDGGADVRRALGKRALSPQDAARILFAVAKGLDHAHDNQILHLDVSPENILIDAKRRVRLTDFGAARAAAPRVAAGSDSLTLAVTQIHQYKQGYIDPDVLRGHVPSRRSDQFGLAATGLELLHPGSRTPFPLPIERLALTLSTAGKNAFDRALGMNRQKPFDTCASFVRTLASAEGVRLSGR